ncbi:uncharacterized protein LOC105384310 isoform X1 [Plutella xylostella]|uniref:uncharacterized protein LOC105384310 isoform X1 n=1 Tax=Plutella xylostella TaxID=51655 RepID=UPI00203297E4|nr:uncharacterized protein LOC105384310 isoform X1 [Plutella xylostella]
MNDPWDVKSVRHSSQYSSCMKLYGVPLLPPLLSKECRKEMQYYKLLAKEVENRIATLKTLVSCESDTDKTEAAELSGFECDSPPPEPQSPFNTSGNKSHLVESLQEAHIHETPKSNKYNKENVSNRNNVSADNLEFIGNGRPSGMDSMSLGKKAIDPQIPERDCDGLQQTPAKELDVDTVSEVSPNKHKDLLIFRDLNHDILDKYFPTDLNLNQDGPSSLSSKSFTGSLIDIHTESLKESQGKPTLVRQSSYTVLQPSPQLLAHLEVQSMSTGVDMQSISMSDSVSNLTMQNNKKRRIWDLETAKNKWSTMALELDRKSNAKNKEVPKSAGKPVSKVSPPARSKSAADKPRRSSFNSKSPPKSEPAKLTPKKNGNSSVTCSTPKTVTKDCVDKSPKSMPVASKQGTQAKTSNGNTPPSPRTPVNGKPIITPSEDPAAKVKELYEKIQKQQLLQMATLVEKQKREQQLLQEVFQEQNNLLYSQLKTVCPKSPIEARPAWGEEVDSGPVSLSQLINKKDISPTSTLTHTSKYINYCDDVLKKSRDITSSLKKSTTPTLRTKSARPVSPTDPYRTRTNSPNQSPSSTPRRLDSTSNGRESELILTDRTNDTLADLNVTFPTDESEGHDTVIRQMCLQELTVVRGGRVTSLSARLPSSRRKIHYSNPTPEERAAASTIVAYARGYLVRRLMRTERVQATVQTIRDALLCALQLHQDRGGIRGADVDLHRRLIQQITAACYSLHDTFVAAPASARCAAIAADRARRRALLQRATPPPRGKRVDIMSQSHIGVFTRPRKTPPSAMTQSNYESFSDLTRPSRVRRPWR